MHTLVHRARRNIGSKLSAEILIRSLAFLFVVAAARFLGDRDYGQYSLAYFFATFLTLFSDWGLNTVLIRDVSRNRNALSPYVHNVLTLKLLFSAVSLLAAPAALWLLGYSGALLGMILLSMLYFQGNHLVDFFAAVTNSMERMEYELFIKGLAKVLAVLLPLVLLLAGYGLWGLLWGLVAGYGAGVLLSAGIIHWKFTPVRLAVQREQWRYLLRSAWPIGLSGLFMTLYARMDIILLSWFGIPPAEIGWYALPVKMVEMLSLFPMLVMAGLFPIFSALTMADQETLKKTYRRALTLMAVLALPLVLVLWVLADDWWVFFFGASFAPSLPALKILLCTLPGIFVNYVFFHTLIALNQAPFLTRICGGAVLFNFGANAVFIPRYGYLGAGGTTVATEFFLVLFCLSRLQRGFYRMPVVREGGKLLVCGGVLACLLWVGKSRPAAPLIWGLALAAYGVGLRIFGLINREDWGLLKRIFHRSKASMETRE